MQFEHAGQQAWIITEFGDGNGCVGEQPRVGRTFSAVAFRRLGFDTFEKLLADDAGDVHEVRKVTIEQTFRDAGIFGDVFNAHAAVALRVYQSHS